MAKDSEKIVDVEAMRHSCAHVLAQAVLDMFPDALLAIGPSIENGFYYDFDLPRTLIPEDLKLLEKKMSQIIKQNQKFIQRSEPVDKAIEFLKQTEQEYKVELAEDLKKEGEKEISFFENVMQDGTPKFVDMCRGPHLESTIKIGAFKLTTIAGAYWRGDEKNKMLQRIYGVCFATKEELDAHLKMLEEARKRDHRKLGKELELFSFHDVGPGFPFFKPKGMVVWNQLMKYWRLMHDKAGYGEVKTPIMLSRKLWETSGHWENYRENMYTTEIDEMDFAIKPMNCPGGMLLYSEGSHSYRELPLRWAEIGLVHRHELSGVLAGLFRVRSFHQDDAHIFMRPDQIKEEILGVLNLAGKVYSQFGLDYHLELSTRPEKSVGSDEAWELATNGLKEALEASGKEYRINEGDGAFYGPKIDLHIKDAIGRTWQCGTIQLDMNLPVRFDLSYIDENGEKQRPVMVHRVVYGSIERFLGVLIEHYAGAFPCWLAPVQVRVLPVSDKFNKYAEKVGKALKTAGARYEIDDSNESLGKKIRNAEMQKIPYMLVVGEKEVADETVMVRDYATKEQVVFPLNKFIEKVDAEGNVEKLV